MSIAASRALAKLETVQTDKLVALSQWLDIKFPGEVGKDREVQDCLLEWAFAIDVARDILREEAVPA